MLQLDGIRLTLGSFTLRADLSVAPAARLAVLGPSGGGKTTLLNVIAGFLRPDAGRVLIDGRDVTGWPVPDRPLSMLFQEGNLFPHLTAFDNVALGIAPNLRLRDADREAVTQAMAQVGLEGSGIGGPATCRAGNARGWRSRGCCCAANRLRCWMSPSPRSTPASGARCWRCWRICAARRA